MSRPITEACVTRALMKARRLPMKSCQGEKTIIVPMCESCEYWILNQKEAHLNSIPYYNGTPLTVYHSCSIKDGFRSLDKNRPCCDGDVEMLSYCKDCEFYIKKGTGEQ